MNYILTLIKRLFINAETIDHLVDLYHQFHAKGGKKPPVLDNLDDAIVLSYLFLRADQLWTTGLWGRSISKNLLINYPNDPNVKNRLANIKACGSITHTAFALKGFTNLKEALGYCTPIDPCPIIKYLLSIQHESGVFHPEPEKFTGGSGGEYRHNTTALIALFYLQNLTSHRNIQTIAQTWAMETLKHVLKLPEEILWFCDRKYETTLLYMIWCLQLYGDETQVTGNYFNGRLREGIWAGVLLFLDKYYSNGLFFQNSHRESGYYYSLIALEILLGTNGFLEDDKCGDIAWRVLEHIASVREDGGVPLGNHKRLSYFSIPDIGTTARFHNTIALFLRMGEFQNSDRREKAKTWKRESVNFIRRQFLSLTKGNYNAMTHSFESLLSMTPHIDVSNRNTIFECLTNVDSLVDSWKKDDLIRHRHIYKCQLQYPTFASSVVLRDLIHNPSQLRRSIGFQSYWG